MAFSFTKGTPTTGAIAMYDFKQRLVSAGWSVVSSSDGLSNVGAGDRIASGGSGANGFANNSAWVQLRSPVGSPGPHFTIQRGTTNLQWRIKYSMAAGFTGGSPGATQTPSASDENVVFGGGTDASPTFSSLLAADGSYRWNVGADAAAPYGFWAGAFPTGGGNPTTAFVFEPLTQTEPTDAHVYAVYLTSGNSAFGAAGSLVVESWTSSNSLLSSVPSTAPTASDLKGFTAFTLNFGTNALVPNGLPTNPITNKDEVFPIIIARRVSLATPGYKGVLSLMKWTGTFRATADTLTVSSTRDRIIYRDVSLPWDGSVPSV